MRRGDRGRRRGTNVRENPMEDGMDEPTSSKQNVSDQLHPLVHKAAAGLLIWFVVAAWLLFGSGGYIGLALAMAGRKAL
jgi:hypothetical protein